VHEVPGAAAREAEVGRRLGGALEERRGIRPLETALGIGEVVEKSGTPGGAEGLRQRDEHRVTSVAARAVAEDDERLSRSVQRRRDLDPADAQLLHDPAAYAFSGPRPRAR